MRSDLHLSDLHAAKLQNVNCVSKLMNTKIPVSTWQGIVRVCREQKCTRIDAVTALLNEGLDAADLKLKNRKPPKREPVPKVRQCSRSGCVRRVVARGLCTSHYQRERNKPGWKELRG